MKTNNIAVPRRAPLGELLIEQGLITAAELDAALAFKESRGVKLGQALVSLHLVTESDLANTLKLQGTIPCIHLTPEIVDPEVAALLGAERSRNLQALAVNQIAGIITVAMEDPSDPYLLDAITVQLNRSVFPVYAEPSSIQACLEEVFRARASQAPSAPTSIGAPRKAEPTELDLCIAREEDGDVAQLELPVVNMVRSLLEEACESHATDIHLEPHAEGLHVRYRVDGYLRDQVCLPMEWALPLMTRLKILVNVDTMERRLPQQGTAQTEVSGRRIELTVSTVPTIGGEGAVIRLSDPARALLSLADLGFTAAQHDRVLHVLQGRQGLVLATGPTNHGKVTTLYALLQHANRPEAKVVTIEDRIENRVSGITQVQTDARVGLTLPRGISALLSQDPDVLLIGHIREDQTAELAVQAALSGRLVLSTLDSPGAVEAVARLLEMGVSRYAIADSLRAVIAQRLVRRICPHCRHESAPSAELALRLGLSAGDGPFFRGQGCPACRESGYLGRVPLFEILDVDSTLGSLMRTSTGLEGMRDAVRASGMLSLRDEGLNKARAGETTLDEVYSATSRS